MKEGNSSWQLLTNVKSSVFLLLPSPGEIYIALLIIHYIVQITLKNNAENQEILVLNNIALSEE